MIRIYENKDITALNSFGVVARAARFIEWQTPHDLTGIFSDGGVQGGAWMVLGGGNNILFTQDYVGTLLHPVSETIEISTEDDKTVTVRAQAGVDWDSFTEWCAVRGLWGAENLTGIPGSVGACPIQNIGAYGAEAKNIIESVECFCVESGKMLKLATEHCGFGYRDSVFKRSLKGKVIITAVDFVLSKEPEPNLTYAVLAEKMAGTEPTLRNIRCTVAEIRNSKLPDPKTIGNAGSFFKNPVVDGDFAKTLAGRHRAMPLYPCGEAGKVKLAAGWLIDAAGWKGRTKGRVGIHSRQALIVVNLGGATGREIAGFAREVQSDVESKFGVRLETEVNIV